MEYFVARRNLCQFTGYPFFNIKPIYLNNSFFFHCLLLILLESSTRISYNLILLLQMESYYLFKFITKLRKKNQTFSLSDPYERDVIKWFGISDKNHECIQQVFNENWLQTLPNIFYLAFWGKLHMKIQRAHHRKWFCVCLLWRHEVINFLKIWIWKCIILEYFNVNGI